jgi:hypothetical protein
MVTITASSAFWLAGLKKIFCVPLCAELHEGAEQLRQFQGKPEPTVNGKAKVSVTSLMAAMVSDMVSFVNVRCIIVLDAYFAVGPVFSMLKQVVDASDKRLVHIVTRAKSNAVGHQDPPPKTGRRGRPCKYGPKLTLMDLFADREDQFEQTTLDLYGQVKSISFLCLDLIWKPVQEKVRFVLVRDGAEAFVLMCSDLTLSAQDIIKAYSYRFKIEVNFKILKHLMGVFFYRFWTSVWPRIRTKNESDLSIINDARSEKLIKQTMNAIEGFVNFGCIATGLLQIVSMSFHQTIWKQYTGWLRTVTSTIPSEEIVRSVLQEEFFHNFRAFSNSAIYRIIMSKSRKYNYINMPLAA